MAMKYTAHVWDAGAVFLLQRDRTDGVCGVCRRRAGMDVIVDRGVLQVLLL